MPKRVVDGEGIWNSDKLRCLPPELRAEYANLISLAKANGSFECNPRLVWKTVYAYNRPEVTEEFVEHLLNQLERVKLLFRWEAKGKMHGYWIGIDKQGRLPSIKRREDKHEVLGEEPPAELLKLFINNGQPTGNQPDANGPVGFGFGSGFCSGSGTEAGEREQDMSRFAESRDRIPPPYG